MSMNKIANINLETTADYQSLSGLNVQFWNQDKGTAVLQFNITRNNYPLGLSTENVKVFIALESGDSFLVDDKLDYLDELNGVVAYTIPNEFMRVATSVKGQVYVTTLDEEEVVVQRQFTFMVANDLIADLPSEDKIREIKYFSDMRVEVAQMMEKLNNDFANMNDYVAQVEQTTQDGITALTNLINTKQKAYNDNHTAKLKELNDKGTEYSNKFDSDKQYIDEKTEAFRESVAGSGLVTTGESANWQKYKLTDDSGILPIVNLNGDLEALQALPSGFYYISFVPITGMGQTSSTGFVTVWESNGEQVKHISFKPYNSSQEFIMRYYREWSGWENKFDGLEKSIDAQAKANVAETNAKVYTDEQISSRTATIFNGTANGVDTNISLSESLDNFLVLYVYGNFDGGNFVETGDPEGSSDIVIDRTNVIGTDGAYATVFECIIQKASRTQLKIISDTYHGINTNNGSGPNANRFTINKIVGVRK